MYEALDRALHLLDWAVLRNIRELVGELGSAALIRVLSGSSELGGLLAIILVVSVLELIAVATRSGSGLRLVASSHLSLDSRVQISLRALRCEPRAVHMRTTIADNLTHLLGVERRRLELLHAEPLHKFLRIFEPL